MQSELFTNNNNISSKDALHARGQKLILRKKTVCYV